MNLTFVRAVTLVVTLLAMLGASGCTDSEPTRQEPAGESPTAPSRTVDISASTLSEFGGFPVYWVGSDYAGSKLDRIIGQYPGEERDPFLLLYGTCGETFETGCVEDLVVKTQPGCLRSVDADATVRERSSRTGGHLEIQTGDVIVTIYAATREMEVEAAQSIVTANAGAAADIPTVVAGSALPGSLCELSRLHPRVIPTAPAALAATTEEPLPATVIASFGDFSVAKTFADAEEKLGARVLRSNDPRYTLVGPGVAAIRRFKNDLPRLEQMNYVAVGHKYAIVIAEEPESYPETNDPKARTSIEDVGLWQVQWREGKTYVFATFFSGDAVAGQRIRVSVANHGGYSLDEMRSFVRTLSLSD